jgi:A/G-specific adenine glycosylase
MTRKRAPETESTRGNAPDGVATPNPGSAGKDDLGGDWVAAIQERLRAWYPQVRRELPWRVNRDAYRILVSEFMLVQTTVAAVIPYFERFLSRFPDLASLANSDEQEVLKAWEGLGYYRRARQLRAAAQQLVREHGGIIPDDPAVVRALPGVGRYIAGALLSFAFDRPEPIVEANSQRVLARLIALREDVRTAQARVRLWEIARRLVPARNAGDFNQALMDLGALVCTPRRPLCLVCPVSAYCQARRAGLADVIPPIIPRRAPAPVTEATAVVVRDGKLLIVQRGSGGLWEKFWEFPTIHVAGADPAGRSLGSAVELPEGILRLTGIRAEVGPEFATIRFSVTNHRVRLIAHRAKARSGRLAPGPGLVAARWVDPSSLSDYTFSSGGRRLIARIRGDPDCLV